MFKKAAHRFFPRLFPAYIAVLDFHRSGSVHLHLVVALKEDIREGWNFEGDEQLRALRKAANAEHRKLTPLELRKCRLGDRSITVNSEIKVLFATLRRALPKFGFPKSFPFEMKPIRNVPALARYLARRYRESQARRDLRPPHSRCIRYSKSYSRCVDKKHRFSANGPGARLYRRKKAAIGAALGIHDVGQMIQRFGPQWEHDLGFILQPVNPYHSEGFFDDQLEHLEELCLRMRIVKSPCLSVPPTVFPELIQPVNPLNPSQMPPPPGAAPLDVYIGFDDSEEGRERPPELPSKLHSSEGAPAHRSSDAGEAQRSRASEFDAHWGEASASAPPVVQVVRKFPETITPETGTGIHQYE